MTMNIQGNLGTKENGMKLVSACSNFAGAFAAAFVALAVIAAAQTPPIPEEILAYPDLVFLTERS